MRAHSSSAVRYLRFFFFGFRTGCALGRACSGVARGRGGAGSGAVDARGFGGAGGFGRAAFSGRGRCRKASCASPRPTGSSGSTESSGNASMTIGPLDGVAVPSAKAGSTGLGLDGSVGV
ncbi:hypothetical protein [Actinocorallia herbida]|uniref:hypothetical protein n=1 Tax=Actinocorallia herbida TaxID=58109 RepID=UPI000F4B583D|nr:hypothetical protein [Actinocorallia herbida]